MEIARSILAVLVGIVFVIGLAALILRLVNRLTLGRSMTPEEIANYSREIEERLTQPRWHELEQHFGRSIPVALRSLFTDADRRSRACFYVVPSDGKNEHYIQRFEPADLQTLKSSWIPLEEKRLPFASDDFDNFYFIEMGENWKDSCPVYYYDHDSGDISEVSDSLETFLGWNTRSESERPT